MYTDIPKTKKAEDILGRYSFAKQIAYGLTTSFLDTNDSIVIGINGSWGSGKTTLINFLFAEINQFKNDSHKLITFKFNPWMFTGQEKLQSSFLKELAIQLEHHDTKMRKVAKKIEELLMQLQALKYLHSGIGEAIREAQSIVKTFAKERPLEDLKREIDSILINNNYKLYISIDDIDRLAPEEVTQIFQLVKLNANFANTVFFVAFDREIVTHALVNQYGPTGSKYLEKIIQVDYTLPELNEEKILEVFSKELQTVISYVDKSFEIESVRDSLWEDDLKYYLKNLRDVFRLLNAVKLRLPAIYQEINIKDFILVEALRIFSYDAYQFVHKKKYELLNHATDSSYSNKEKPIKLESEALPHPANGIIDRLFFNGDNWMGSMHFNEFIQERHICSKFYFDRYFSLQLSDSEISELVYKKIIEAKTENDILPILEAFIKKDILADLLLILEKKVYRLDKEIIGKIWLALARRLAKERYIDWHYFRSNTNYNIIYWSLSNLQAFIRDGEYKYSIISDFLLTPEYLITPAHLHIINGIDKALKSYRDNNLYDNSMWSGLFSSETTNKFENLLSEQHIKVLQSLAFQLNQNICSFSIEELHLVLPQLWDKTPELYEQLILPLVNDIHALSKLLEMMITRRYISGARTGYALSKELFLPQVTEEMIDNTISAADGNTLKQDEAKAISFYQNAKAHNFDENKYFDYDTLELLDFHR